MGTLNEEHLVFLSDEMYTPIHYKGMIIKQPLFEGKGHQSVAQLEAICEQTSKEPTRLSFYVKYCDEFTEDLLKYLMEWSQKNTTLKDRGRDNSFKGLKEDGYFLFDNFGLTAPKSCLYKDIKLYNYGYGVDNNHQGCLNEYSVKQVKELIGYKEPTKSIEKWSVGSYVVFLEDIGHVKKGHIDIIKEGLNNFNCVFLEKYLLLDISREKHGEIKWFATKSEAEEFAKTLVFQHNEETQLTSFPNEGWCKTSNVELRKYLAKRPNTRVFGILKWIKGKSIGVGWNKRTYWIISEKSNKPEYKLNQLEKFFSKEKTKRPLKQAVYCKTIEEYKFTKEKLGAIFYQHAYIKEGSVITLDEIDCTISLYKFSSRYSHYKLLSFQEWCDLNGYKMKVEQPLKQMDNSRIFEVGDYVVITKSNINWTREMDSEIGKVVKITYIDNDGYINYRGKPGLWSFGMYDNHFRHATQEEIKNLKTASTGILDESYIGKFVSFIYGLKFYNKALIIKENDYIYLLNNCHGNNNGHSDKSIYKYSLKFRNFSEVKSLCKNIEILNTEEVLESQCQKSVQPDGLRLKTKNSHITIDYIKIEPKEKTKLREFKFNYLPEPE